MNYSLEFQRARFRTQINNFDDIDDVRKLAEILLDGYIDLRIIFDHMGKSTLRNSPLTVTPETLGQVAQDRDT